MKEFKNTQTTLPKAISSLNVFTSLKAKYK